MPARKPSIAVLGCGAWGQNLVRNFAQLGRLHVVCDAGDAGRQRAAVLAPGTRIASDPAEIWDSAAAGVAIATPAETHAALTRQALLAGKDVLCEKPLALTYDEGAALVQLAEQQGRILMVGHVLEYHPAVLALRELVEGDRLGSVQYIYSNRLSLGKVRREENILWSFAPHDIAVILRLVGDLPAQVVACGGSYVQPAIVDVTVTHLWFDRGVRAHIHVSWLHPFKEQRLVVIGSRKMASFDDVAKQLILYDQRVAVRKGEPVSLKGRGEEIPYAQDEPLRRECEAFLASMASRQPPLTDGASALRVLQVLDAAQRSLKAEGEPVALPAVEAIP